MYLCSASFRYIPIIICVDVLTCIILYMRVLKHIHVSMYTICIHQCAILVYVAM